MSATGRSPVRRVDDFYETPAWGVRAIVPHLGLRPSDRVLDPCCGRGAITQALPSDLDLVGLELDAGRASEAASLGHTVQCRDALAPEPWPAHRVLLTNPPYRLALEFVERALREAAPRGVVAMLLRLGFLESKKRAAFHQQHPADVFVLSERPSFTGRGTDAAAYGWFLWGGRGGRWRLLVAAR